MYMNEPYSILMQKTTENAPVKDSLAHFGIVCTEFPFKPMEVLLEIHNPSELPYINKEVDMLGVNNRNLGTFVTDVKNSFRIARQLQQAIGSKKGASDVRNMPILVSESGISHPETIRSLRAAGFRGFLIGEAFMKTDRPGDTLKDFISPIISQK